LEAVGRCVEMAMREECVGRIVGRVVNPRVHAARKYLRVFLVFSRTFCPKGFLARFLKGVLGFGTP